MDFIFMLTRGDRTVEDSLDVLDVIAESGIHHIGFKDVGASPETMAVLARRIRSMGAVSYLEVVSTTRDSVLRSLTTAAELGVDRVLGGTEIEPARRLLGDLSRYYPFVGRPVGHPTRLDGSGELVAEQCRTAMATGCGGVDLLAYRATEAEPLSLVRAARRALNGGQLIVAGSVNSVERIHALGAAGADAFTIGSAAFDGSFCPSKGTLRGQIADILEACRTAPRMAA